MSSEGEANDEDEGPGGLAMLAGVAVSVTGIAVGQDAIAQRKELMKQVGGSGEDIQ